MEKGVAETMRKIADIGYKAIQTSGFGPVSAKDVASIVEDNGLTVASTHVSWERFLNDLDAVIEEHKLWKCRHPAIGGLPVEYRSLEGLKARYGEKTWLAMLYEQAAPDVVKAEIDVYWIQAGGGDPALWVQRCAGREPLLHLKDMSVTPEREQRFAEIGEGNLNWSAIMDAAREGGVEWYLVEQDDCYGRDPFESLAISYRNHRSMGLSYAAMS